MTTDGSPMPLARLLGLGFRQLIDDLHVRLVERGWTDVRESYGFVLLALREQETTTTELGALLGVSKQAMSKLLDAMDAAGYVERRDDPRDGRAKAVGLAGRGRALLAVVESIYTDLEAEWAGVIGPAAVVDLRHGIEAVLRSRHGGELPRLRPA